MDNITEFLSSGSGSGSGYGSGDGYGSGSGDGYGSGLMSINKKQIYMIDGIQTTISSIRGNIAKGCILREDLSRVPCYIAKLENVFAHGETIKIALESLKTKIFKEMPESERIDAFVKVHELDTVYPNKDFFSWHNKLTGSCLMGRNEFAISKGIDLNSSMTTLEFILLTENNYGFKTIKKLKKHYNLH